MEKRNGKTALLVMDLQNGIVSRFAEKPEVLHPFQKAVEGARQNDIPVKWSCIINSKGSGG